MKLSWYTVFIKELRSESDLIIPIDRKRINIESFEIIQITKFAANSFRQQGRKIH